MLFDIQRLKRVRFNLI